MCITLFFTETIYRHELTVGGEAVNFEILDTAGQVRDMMAVRTPSKMVGWLSVWIEGHSNLFSMLQFSHTFRSVRVRAVFKKMRE